MAARRPVPAAVLEEVARSSRFGRLHPVRRALALNPYAPPALVCSILPALDGNDLREVLGTESLHDGVRAAARALLAARGLAADA
jgi:hypothetical protein